jgi:DNA-binding XRE family transcriptional regulator
MSASNDPFSDHPQLLASQVRAARARCAFSIESLAKLAGVDPSVIVRVEMGDLNENDALCRERVFNTLGLTIPARR